MVDPWTLLAGVMCGAICVRVATYQRNGARYRLGVSCMAYLLAAGAGCESLSVTLALLFAKPVTPVSPFLLLILLVVLGLVFRSQGNVARIMQLDWQDKWDGQERRQ